jgi:hypothetical protein
VQEIDINHIDVTGLEPGKPYYFVVQSKTGSHENNKNTVLKVETDIKN